MLQSNPVMASSVVLKKSAEGSEGVRTPAAAIASILGLKDFGKILGSR